MRCPRCGHDNAKGVEICQGCRKVKFVQKARPADKKSATAPSSSSGTVEKAPPPKRPEAATQRVARPPAPVVKAPTKPVPKVAPPKPVSKKPKKHLLARAGAPALELKTGEVFTFGRNDTCSLPIPSGRVSRVHAHIKWVDDAPVLEDLGSANGTFVNGKPVKEHPLAAGDEIEIGPFLCAYKNDDSAPVPPTAIRTVVDQGDLLNGAIGEGGLTEVFQGIDFNKKSGTLFVFSAEGQGWVTFQDGVPQAAEAAMHKDSEAIFFLLAIKVGRFSFTTEMRTKEKRLKATITGLLLEWGRRADEAGR